MDKHKLISGDKFIGRWYQKKYIILSQLGKGGTARVYLAVEMKSRDIVALKISDNISSLNREYNIMKLLSANSFSPHVYEIDDFEAGNCTYHYIAMEYIQGITLKELIDKELDIRAIISIIKILAVIINVLHKNGYIYCDLKPENIIYDKKEMRIVLIDYGGVVKRGSGVVEFTPTFDRCSWGIGTRLADESYDIFALCMLLVILLNRRVYSPSKQELNNILNKISVSGMGFIRNGLTLKYKNIAEFYKDMESLKYTQNIVKDRKYEKMLNSLLIIAISMFLCIIIAASKKMGF